MEARLSQTSVGPVIIFDLLSHPELPILGCASSCRLLPAAGAHGPRSLDYQEGHQVQVQTCCPPSGPWRVLSTLRTRDPHLEDRGACARRSSQWCYSPMTNGTFHSFKSDKGDADVSAVRSMFQIMLHAEPPEPSLYLNGYLEVCCSLTCSLMTVSSLFKHTWQKTWPQCSRRGNCVVRL